MNELDTDPQRCVFCAIVRGDGEASIVYEDSEVLAFTDLMPVTPGHVLVIPKMHVPYLSWAEEFLAAKVFLVAHQLAGALQRTEFAEPVKGVNLFAAEGVAAGQEVGHLHLHVIPRYDDDGFGLRRRATEIADRADLDAVAARIRTTLTEPDIPEQSD